MRVRGECGGNKVKVKGDSFLFRVVLGGGGGGWW